MTRRVDLEAFAKVNRWLHVLGKRPDGYHELDTLFQTIDLSDRLTFSESRAITLELDDARLPADGRNLVVRAAQALAEAFHVRGGASIRLEKRIPVGAGLGGGSSDAAATLIGLAALWSLPARPEDLLPIAEKLGSDVPFFLFGGRARGTGRGEQIEPLPDEPEEHLVLVFPPFSLSTATVYGALRAPALTLAGPLSKLTRSDPGGERDRNDLETAAESLRQELRQIREALKAAGARSARMSGSGSTVFGVFGDAPSAREAASRLSGLTENTRVEVVRTLSRDEFARRSRGDLLGE